MTGHQATPQVITTTTNTRTSNYIPPAPVPAPAYYPTTGYQPYPPAGPPPAATAKY